MTTKLTAARLLAIMSSSVLTLTVLANPANAETNWANEATTDLTQTQWGLLAVRAAEANATTKGSGVVVAVVDTGVDGTHPDLAGRVTDGYSTIEGRGLIGAQDNDADEHGTHVAGIIAGSDDGTGITGVAPEATIMPVQVLGPDGGTDESVAAGIDYAVAHGAKIINLSLGGQVNPFENGGSVSCAAVERAFAADVVVIVAAGNAGGAGNPLSEPASCAGALSVGAVDENLDRTYFSSFDATVGIAAPGRRIVSSIPTHAGYYPFAQWDGTSMATPFVSGVAALVRAAHPEWSAQQVVDQLKSTAVDIASPGVDPETGYGLVDAAAALGESAWTKEDAKSAAGLRVSPVVRNADFDGTNTSVSWQAPLGLAVTGYEIAIIATDGSVVTTNVDEFTLSTTIEGSAFEGYIVVKAVVEGGERLSFPYTGTTDSTPLPPSPPAPKLTKLSAVWVEKGISIKWDYTNAEGTLRLMVNQLDGGLFVYIDVAASDRQKLVKVGAENIARGSYVDVWLTSSDDSYKHVSLVPQYKITASGLSAGAYIHTVVGKTGIACFGSRRGCTGAIATVYDAKTKSVLGRSRVLENLTYAVDFKNCSPFKRRVYVVIEGVKSATITLPVKK